MCIRDRVKTIHYKWNSESSDNSKEWIINKPAIIVLDARWLPINIELTVLYQLKETEAAETIEKYGFSWDEKIVNPSVREVVRDVLWNYEAEVIPEKRQEIANKIKSSLQEKFKNSVVRLIDVQLRNIELPSRIKEKILQVQEAKQAAEKQKYELERAKIEAQTKVVKAKAQADSQIEYARWQAESIKIAAKAEAEKIKLKAQAQAEANKKISTSLTPNLIKYETIKAWNGSLPPIIGSNGNILSLPSSLFK
jgi:regulator of protease activity HflC (stomatin/prohibitin superfamily)